MDRIINLVRRVRGNNASAKREREAEPLSKPRRHRRCQAEDELEIHDDGPLDLESLQFEMPSEEMWEAQSEPKAEVATED
ncbi:hypothetical protein TSUD_377210 [Trifolium subterraneum]|nr:hypothetical protein TSUD_377210 [Trifolium subterraneum]